jgi:hypothetical protein
VSTEKEKLELEILELQKKKIEQELRESNAHICLHGASDDAPDTWKRIKFTRVASITNVEEICKTVGYDGDVNNPERKIICTLVWIYGDGMFSVLESPQRIGELIKEQTGRNPFNLPQSSPQEIAEMVSKAQAAVPQKEGIMKITKEEQDKFIAAAQSIPRSLAYQPAVEAAPVKTGFFSRIGSKEARDDDD